MSITKADRETVSRRIRALLSKTIENGATEAEAMTAAEKARELMDQHRLQMTDIEIEEEPVISEEVDRPNRLKLAAVDDCTRGIEYYCGVKIRFHKKFIRDEFLRKGRDFIRDRHDGKIYSGEWRRKLVILGLKADVEMAHYLYDLIAGAFRVDLERSGYRSREDRTSFQVGMAERINSRLIRMARDLEPKAKTATGTALVRVKNQVVDEAFDRLDIKLTSKGLAGMSAYAAGAHAHGWEAGGDVNLSRPVTGANQRRLTR